MRKIKQVSVMSCIALALYVVAEVIVSYTPTPLDDHIPAAVRDLLLQLADAT